jgi:hypothetical protein
MQLLALLGVLTLLVCNAAAGLASRLAGSLALAAAAVLSTVTQITSLNSLDMLHDFTFYNSELGAFSLAQFNRNCQSPYPCFRRWFSVVFRTKQSESSEFIHFRQHSSLCKNIRLKKHKKINQNGR